MVATFNQLKKAYNNPELFKKKIFPVNKRVEKKLNKRKKELKI